MPISYILHLNLPYVYTVRYLARKCKLPLRNINDLPVTKDKRLLNKAAATQVVKIVRQVMRPEAKSIWSGSKYPVMIPSDLLFPQLGLQLLQTNELREVYGKYVDTVVDELAKLPPKSFFFGLAYVDAPSDVVLLRSLSEHPKLRRHHFLMTRPVQDVCVLSDADIKKMMRKFKSGKAKPDRAVIECSYATFKLLQDKHKSVDYLRYVAKNGGLLVFD